MAYFLVDSFWLFKIGFLPVRFWDILDVLIVGYLMYLIYRLLKGNIAFNILIGVVILFFAWELVKQLEMVVLEAAMQRFVGVGVIILAIIFQQEIRRFLLLLGNTTLRQRTQFLGRFIDKSFKDGKDNEVLIEAIHAALLRLSRHKTGALIVFTDDVFMEPILNTGTILNAKISQPLIESIFNKTSPLHDGAVLMGKSLLIAASCILPVSESNKLHASAGLRHRAAVGVTERFEVTALVVSEESGQISFAKEGVLQRKLKPDQLKEILQKIFV